MVATSPKTDLEIFQDLRSLFPQKKTVLVKRGYYNTSHIVMRKSPQVVEGVVSGTKMKFRFKIEQKPKKGLQMLIKPNKRFQEHECRKFLERTILKIKKENDKFAELSKSGKGIKHQIGKGFSVRIQTNLPDTLKIKDEESQENFSIGKYIGYFEPEFIKFANQVNAKCFFKK